MPRWVEPGAIVGAGQPERARLLLNTWQCEVSTNRRMKRDLMAASAEPLILSQLAQGETCGFEIIRRIRSGPGEEMTWTDGVLYPVLHRLEDKGWISSRWVTGENGRRRKYYALSPAGKKARTAPGNDGLTMASALPLRWEGGHV